MAKKKFTSADLFSSEYCQYIRYDFTNSSVEGLSNINYSIKGSGTSIVGSFFSKGSTVIETHSKDEVISLDIDNKEIVVRPTITLSSLYELLIPQHLFLGSVPSYPGASIGGCIAANVHGQNHVKEGCFTNNVKSLVVYHPDKGFIECSPNKNKNLFDLTIGGYGATGIIHEVRLNLIDIKTNILNVKTITFSTLFEAFQLMEKESYHYDYLHSWCDMSIANRTKQPGLISLGRYESGIKVEKYKINNQISKVHMPILINVFGTRLMITVNKLYYFLNTIRRHKKILLHDFIFPSRSNLFYFSMFGKKGIIEHQVLIPKKKARNYLEDLMVIIESASPSVSLCHLKVFSGDGSLLRFDGSGYCLALHFYNDSSGINALKEIDKIDLHYGCKANLIKDSRLSVGSIDKQYSEIGLFRSKIHNHDPLVKFRNNIINKVFNKNG
jgi:decaprenylphospho-beta-D-ribofuranose 2-oxidase